MAMRADPIERFWRHVAQDEHTGCWEWTGALAGRGYAHFWVFDGDRVRQVYGHRFAYEVFIGPIPDDLYLDHICRNIRCVNPCHLEPVTQHENWRRGASPTRLKALQTYCERGHPFDRQNTIWSNGKRRCRACLLEWQRKHKNWQGGIGKGWLGARTHCPQGHPLSGDNLRLEKDGGRRCRTCHRDQQREYLRRRQGGTVP